MIVDFEIFSTLKEWNSRLEANKPACIKKVETGIDFVESDKEGDEECSRRRTEKPHGTDEESEKHGKIDDLYGIQVTRRKSYCSSNQG